MDSHRVQSDKSQTGSTGRAGLVGPNLISNYHAPYVDSKQLPRARASLFTTVRVPA